MSIGIESLGVFLPEGRLTIDPAKLGMTPEFLHHTVGIHRVAIIDKGETAMSGLLKAFEDLSSPARERVRTQCRLLIVIGQTLDTNMPHTSAMLHGRLGLAADCATFDVSLGCTGFVHGLAIAKSYMEMFGIEVAMVCNVELMSRIVDRSDRATGAIFGDAVTVTVLSRESSLKLKCFTAGSQGGSADALRCEGGRLHMDGQVVYEFVARNIPKAVKSLLASQNLRKEDVDRFLFHQGSRRTVEKIQEFLGLDAERAPFAVANYGNVGACSIPVLLKPLVEDVSLRRLLLCGFGVGLAWTAGILERKN